MTSISPKPTSQQWLQLLDRLIDLGVTLHRDTEIPITAKGAADVPVICMAIACRTVGHLKAIREMVTAHQLIEARILTRCCFENLFFVAALVSKKDAFVEQMRDETMAQRKARGQLIMQLTKGGGGANWAKTLQVYLARIEKRALKRARMDPSHVAGLGPMEKSYIYYAQLSADSSHPTLDALGRYITRDDDGLMIDINPVRQDKEFADTLAWACEATIGTLVGVNEVVQGTVIVTALEQAMADYHALESAAFPAKKP